MVIYSALVRSHQSTSRVASASMRGGEHRSSVRHTHSATGDVKASSLESSPGIEESSLASRRRGRGSDTPSTRPERSALRLLSIDTLARCAVGPRTAGPSHAIRSSRPSDMEARMAAEIRPTRKPLPSRGRGKCGGARARSGCGVWVLTRQDPWVNQMLLLLLNQMNYIK